MPIFDQGYQHWNGRLSGHAWRSFTIARHGVRIGMKGRALRVFLLASWMPALGLATVLCLWGLLERQSDFASAIAQFLAVVPLFTPTILADPRHYRLEVWTLCYDFFLSIELRLSMVLVVLIGPDLISQDLRFNALPLYLSRPLRRIDYFAGKLGVIAAFLGMVILLPCLIAYALGLLFSLDFSIVRDTYRLLLATLAYGVVIIVSAGTLILALSSLSRNSRYVALFWLGVWIVSGIVSSTLESTYQLQRRQAFFQQTRSAAPRPAPLKAAAPGRRSRPRPEPRPDPLADFRAEEIEAQKSDWRPLVSYTANLSRIGRQLLGTDDCVRTIGALQPPATREMFLWNSLGPQYPWIWSAGVLAGLLGLSACIMNVPIRSLDRLK